MSRLVGHAGGRWGLGLVLGLVWLLGAPGAVLAQPTIESVVVTADTANGTDHVINIPDGTGETDLSSGDLAVVVFATDGQETITWPTGWTSTLTGCTDQSSVVATVEIRYRDADGMEGSTITITTGTSEQASAQVYHVLAANWHGTTAPECATTTIASTANPDPPNLSAANWTGEDTLFIAIAAGDATAGLSTSSYPSGYTANQNHTGTSNGSGFVAGATLGLTSDSSDDPGTFTLSEARQSMGATIAIRGAAGGGPTGPPKGSLMLLGAGL